MKKLFLLLFVFVSLYMTVFATPIQAQECKDWPQGQCGDRCGSFDNCAGPRPGSSGCIDHHTWVGGTCGCLYTGSSWELNADLCPGGEGGDTVTVKGKVMGCQAPLAGVTVSWINKDRYNDNYQYPGIKTAVTDASGNYTMSVGYSKERVFKIEPTDSRTFIGTGSAACTNNGSRPRHTWCQNDTMKGLTENVDFQETNCVSPPSCKNAGFSAGTLINGVRVVSATQDVPYSVTGTGGTSSVELCFHAVNLVGTRTWSQDWHCLKPNRIAPGSETFSGTFRFNDVKTAIVNMNTGYTAATIDADGLRYSTRIYTSENVYCTGSGVWSDGGTHHGSTSCTYNNKDDCIGLIGLAAKIAGPSCKSLTVAGGTLVGGVRQVSPTTPMIFALTGQSGSTSDPTISRNQICFYPNTLGNKNDWSLGWYCISPNPAGINPYTITKTFNDIKAGIRSRDPSSVKITDAQIDADGFRYAGNVHKPDGTFCDGGNNWTGVGSSIYNACTYNTACAGNVGLTTITTPLTKTCSVTSPDPNLITTSQTKRINVSGKSSGSSSEPTRLILSKSDFSQMANKPAGTKEVGILSGNLTRYYYIFQSQIDSLKNKSFETGNTTGWTGSAGNLGEFRAIDSAEYPPASDGKYYLKVVRSASGDAFVVSDWLETNGDVTGQSFNLSFTAKSHIENAAINKIKDIMIQRWPLNCAAAPCANPDFTAPAATFGDVDLSGAWKSFSRNVVFPNPGNGSTTSRVRVVLRLPNTNNVPVYYDNISLTRASNNSFDCETSSSVQCTDSVTLANMPVGSYNAYCDLPTDPGKCTGSPACYHNGCSGAYCMSCSGWENCSDNDNLKFTVQSSCVDTNPVPIISMMVSTIETNNSETAPAALSGNTGSPTQVFMPSASSQIKLHWTNPDSSSNTKYEIVVFKQVYGAAAMSAEDAYAAAKAGSNLAKLYTVNTGSLPNLSIKHPPSYHQDYRLSVAIRAINDNTCPPSGPKVTSWSRFYFDMISKVEGNFRLTTNNSCSMVGTSAANPVGTVTNVRAPGNVLSPTAGLPVNGASSYLIATAPFTPTSQWGSNTIQLDLSDTDPNFTYVCAACNQSGGNPKSCVAMGAAPKLVPSSNNNFYLLQYNLSNDPWWQAVNGLVYAGVAMSSKIPDSCGDVGYSNCIKALVTRAFGSANNKTAGLPLTHGNSINKGDGLFSENDNNPRSTNVDFSAIDDAPEDYDYFVDRTSLTGAPLPATVTTKANLFSGGHVEPADNTKVGHFTGNLTIKPTGGPITIEATEKIVIFVKGNLFIDGDPNTKVFDVKEGGYLGLIVSGEIRVRPNVGHDITDTNENTANTLPANISGVFVANKIIIESDGNANIQDKKFVGEGTYVGWSSTGGVSLNRSFVSNNFGKRFHNGNPTELFIYRPSYLENTPNFMKTPGLLWQEVN